MAQRAGQFAATAASDYLTAKHLSVIFSVSNGHGMSPFELFLAYASAPLQSSKHHFFLQGLNSVVQWATHLTLP
jgi:hypothetical protein